MGGNIGGHAYGNAGRTVEQQIGNLGGQNGGLVQRAIVVRSEIDGILFDISQKLACQPGHAHFRITHGCRGVPVNGAEVALTIHKGIAHAEVLGQTHQGIVHGRVAMGMVFTYDITNDTGRLLVSPVIDVSKLGHSVQNTPMHRLQTISGVRNGTTDNDRQRIFQVGAAKFFFYINLICTENVVHNILE